jgi:hypothetical protein
MQHRVSKRKGDACGVSDELYANAVAAWRAAAVALAQNCNQSMYVASKAAFCCLHLTILLRIVVPISTHTPVLDINVGKPPLRNCLLLCCSCCMCVAPQHKQCVLRFASAATVLDFIAQVQKYKPAA